MDDLGTVISQRPEVGIGRVKNCSEILIGERDVAGEVQRAEVPIRVLKNEIPEEPVAEE